jgi:hypothetical protein
MVAALARLYSEGHQRHGWPYQLANTDGAPGFGYHRMAVNTACPCDVRLNRRSDILAIASGFSPPPSPSTEDNNMMLLDPRSGGYWVAFADGAVHAYKGAPMLGGTNNDKYNRQKWPCIGIAGRRDGNGYTLGLDPGNRDINFYEFPYDGSARP